MLCGDLVIFKKYKREPFCAQETPFENESEGFGIFLGVLTPPMGRPTEEELPRWLGCAGLFTTEDIVEFLGNDVAEFMLRKWIEKYVCEQQSEQLAFAVE